MIEWKITGDALRIIENLKEGMRSADGCVKIIAKRVKDVYVSHFRAKNELPNKMGWPSRGTWAQIARKTSVAYAFEDRAGISIADPIINQKVYGGKITAKTGENLALPANADAYLAGSPREWTTPGDGKLERKFYRKHGELRSMLVAAQNYQRITRKGETKRTKDAAKATEGKGRVWYWLVKETNPPKDPTALPPDDIVLNMIQATAQEISRELMRREAQAHQGA